MRWRRRIGILFSRRLRKIIYVVTVSVMISLAIYNQFGENVSRNSRAHSIAMSNQVSLPKPINLKGDARNPKINRSLKRLSLEERVSNVRYVTIDPRKTTRRAMIVSSSKNHAKVESVDVKRTRESYKRAIRRKFQYTQMSIGDRDGLFNTNSKIQRRRDPKSSVGRSAAYVKGSIRFYVKPEWFSAEDIESMVTLSSKDIIRVNNAKLHSNGINWKTLMFTKDNTQQDEFQFNKDIHQSNLFYGLASHLLSLHEVLAFHLDRVLGIGRALPTVAKHIKGTAARTLNIPENSLHSILAIDTVDIQPVDGLIKRNVLACKSVQLADVESKSTGCGDIDGLEWGKLALFDFLLQIHNRLNQHCCGFQPDINNKCLITLDTKDCTNQKLDTVYKARSNNRLIFLKNEMNLISSGNSIDFEILQGVRKFPTRAVDIIRKGKLKLMLLQSLFIDKAYWDGVGGRGGIDQMINVIAKRARLFLEYYDTHTIKVQ